MTLARLKGIICLAIPLMLAIASGDAAAASPSPSGQSDGLDTPVELPVVFPPVKNIAPKPQPTEQELRTRAEAGNVDAILAYGDSLPTPSDFSWYLKAAEGGSPKAMMIVANRAKEGKTGYGVDQPLSDEWLNKALQTGRQALSRKDIKALNLLLDGDREDGNGLLIAATKAQYTLAIGRAGGFEINDIFASAINAFPNTPEKTQLLQKCSNDGHPWCTSELAGAYLTGNDGVIIDRALGIKLLTKAEQAGYDLGDFNFSAFQNLPQTEKIQLWKIAIEHGAIDDALYLAAAYRDGDGVPKSAPIAAALLQTLIQRPEVDGLLKAEAILDLAEMYVDGKSFPVNEQLFLRVLNSVSSSDEATRENLPGFLLYRKEGLLRGDTLNITESTRLLLLKSVVENSPPFNDGVISNDRYQSALRLGDLYSSGQKMKQSYADAMTWYKKAEQIATGPVDGNFNYDGVAAVKIGKLYENGLGGPKDNSTATSWYQKAADDILSHPGSSSGLAIANLMQLLNSVQLPKEYVDRIVLSLRTTAQGGNGQAQYDLGEMYYEGKYVPQSYSEASGWFEKCSDNGNGTGWQRNCLSTLAQMYMQGQGVMRDPTKAVYYYQQLFNTGWNYYDNPHAEDILLPMYCGGEGIPMDRPKAFALFKQDAGQNVPFGELGAGAMYQMGWGVKQDLAEAFNWYRKAAVDKNYNSTQAKAI